MKIFVGGMHGSGKTTLIDRAVADERLNYEISYPFHSAVRNSGLQVEEFLRLDKEIKLAHISNVMSSICLNDKKLIIDSHYVVFERDLSYIVPFSTFPNEVGNLSAAVMLTCNPHTIEYRLQRAEKPRIFTDPKHISYCQELELDYAMNLCGKYGIPFYIFDNSHTLEKSVDDFRDLLHYIDDNHSLYYSKKS
jgi:adenylate kinase